MIIPLDQYRFLEAIRRGPHSLAHINQHVRVPNIGPLMSRLINKGFIVPHGTNELAITPAGRRAFNKRHVLVAIRNGVRSRNALTTHAGGADALAVALDELRQDRLIDRLNLTDAGRRALRS